MQRDTESSAMPASRQPLPRRRLGRTGLEVTTLGLGGAGFGGATYGAVTDEEAVETVHAAIAGGITYIDTAPLYGESERRLGLALRGIPRGEVVLSTKTGTHPRWRGDYSAEATYRSVENSLRLLGTDYIDLLLVHDPPDLTRPLGKGGAVEALEDLKRQGVIRAIGLGVRGHALHREAIKSGRIDVVLTYLDYNLIRATAADTILPLAEARQVGVINGSPLAMGLLSGVDPEPYARDVLTWAGADQLRDVAAARDLWRWARDRGIDLQALALRFSLREPRIAATIVGAKTAAEVTRNIGAAAASLPDAVWAELAARPAGPSTPAGEEGGA
ncbi:MAG: aldo/keto reductase [Chloroflexota bacterium]